MPNNRQKSPFSIAAWVSFCVFCSCAGWLLSILQELNRAGYAVLFGTGLAVAVLFRNRILPANIPTRALRKAQYRFRHFFPAAFAILAGMSILGGVLHPPNNYDGLAYRTPRVLHWLAEGHWHWIHTDFQRLNTRGCGYEWVTAPLLAITSTDRCLFLINSICFLLLPGRVFSLFVRFGVPHRTAYYWMWLLPSGYCYLLQAGSIGNDLFGAFFAFVAIEFALRARVSGSIGQTWLAILSAGLMTAGKAFNILLGLPWLLAALPALALLRKRPLTSILIIIFGVGASFVPTALLNLHYCGDWSGQAAEKVAAMGTGAPLFHVMVNSLLLLLHNFTPTIFPFAGTWNRLMVHLISPTLSERLSQHFEPGGAKFEVGEMQMEEAAGLGFGLSLLLLGILLCRTLRRDSPLWTNTGKVFKGHLGWVLLATGLGIAYFMTQSGLGCPARYLAPFYPFLVIPILAGSLPSIRSLTGAMPFWRWCAVGVYLLSGLLLIANPSRPLWPAITVLRACEATRSSHPLLARAQTVYSVYDHRGNAFQPALALLPPGTNPLGIISIDDPETSLWRPFGSRRIYHIRTTDSREEIQKHGIQYALVSSTVLAAERLPLNDWLTRTGADVVRQFPLELRAGVGPRDWFLVKWEN